MGPSLADARRVHARINL